MCNQNEWIVREAFLAYDRGDIARAMEFVDPDLEWTYVHTGSEDSQLRTQHGREELAKALREQADRRFQPQLEGVVAAGNRVMVVTRMAGADEQGHGRAGDVKYDVVTVRDGLIVELRACRDHGEARSLAGID